MTKADDSRIGNAANPAEGEFYTARLKRQDGGRATVVMKVIHSGPTVKYVEDGWLDKLTCTVMKESFLRIVRDFDGRQINEAEYNRLLGEIQSERGW